MEVDRIINGSYGELWQNGEWKDHINSLTAEVTVQKNALKTSGSRWDKHKVVGLSGAGTASGFKVTSEMIQQANWTQGDRGVPTTTEFVSWVKDPEAYGFEAIRLKNIKFDKVQLANWTAGQEVKEETPFTFEGWEPMNVIEKS